MELYPGKKRLLQVARRQLALSDQQWRDLLEAETGCRSTRDIDLAGFEAVMERLKALGFESTHARGDYGRRAGMATPNQVRLIQQLWHEYATYDDSRSLDHWLEHSFGISSLRFADSDTTSKAITALKAMVARKKTEGH